MAVSVGVVVLDVGGVGGGGGCGYRKGCWTAVATIVVRGALR